MAMSAARPAAALAILSLMICSLLQSSVSAPCPVSNCAASAAHASAGPYGTYPSLPPPPPRTLSTIPLHPSVPEDAQRSGFVLSPSGRLFLPGSMQVTPALNGSGFVTQCTMNVTFYEVHPDSGEVVRALTDTHVVNALEGVLFDARQGHQASCTAGLGAAAVDEAGGWLYYPVVAVLSGATRYDPYDREVARSFQATLRVRRMGLGGTPGSGSTVLQHDSTNASSPFSNVGLPPSVALSGPADAAPAAPAFLLLIPRIDSGQAYSGSFLALDLSGSDAIRARPVGLGVKSVAWAVDQSTGSGTSKYDVYLLYFDLSDTDACNELAKSSAFQQTPFYAAEYYGSCYSWWVARDKGAVSAAAIATWPVVTLTSGWSWKGADLPSKAAAPPGVDVEVIPLTLTTPSWPLATFAAGGSKVYLSDPFRCQILELDPVTGIAKVAAGYDGGSAGGNGRGGCTRPMCSIFPTDGPAVGNRPIATPGRMAADGSGALVFVDETTGRLRRLGPA